MLIFKVTLLFIGIVFYFIGTFSFIKSHEMISWVPIYDGKVMYAYKQNSSAPIDGAAISGGKDRAVIKYWYKVDDHIFYGSKLAILDDFFFLG